VDGGLQPDAVQGLHVPARDLGQADRVNMPDRVAIGDPEVTVDGGLILPIINEAAARVAAE
jgi:hypothetical protein